MNPEEFDHQYSRLVAYYGHKKTDTHQNTWWRKFEYTGVGGFSDSITAWIDNNNRFPTPGEIGYLLRGLTPQGPEDVIPDVILTEDEQKFGVMFLPFLIKRYEHKISLNQMLNMMRTCSQECGIHDRIPWHEFTDHGINLPWRAST